MSLGIYELVSELQLQMAMVLAHAERGTPVDGDRVIVDFPVDLIEKARNALDMSHGVEIEDE